MQGDAFRAVNDPGGKIMERKVRSEGCKLTAERHLSPLLIEDPGSQDRIKNPSLDCDEQQLQRR